MANGAARASNLSEVAAVVQECLKSGFTDEQTAVVMKVGELARSNPEVLHAIADWKRDMDSKFESQGNKMDSKFAAVDSKFELQNTKFELMSARFERLITRATLILGGLILGVPSAISFLARFVH